MNWNKWIKYHFSPIELSFLSQNITWRMWFSRSSVHASSGKHLCSDSIRTQHKCWAEDRHNRNRYCIQNGCPLDRLSWQWLGPEELYKPYKPYLSVSLAMQTQRLTNLYTSGMSVPPAPMVFRRCLQVFSSSSYAKQWIGVLSWVRVFSMLHPRDGYLKLSVSLVSTG